MNETSSASGNTAKLQPYLSPLAVWALSVGSAIGWGSLVVTSRSYLSQAGPLGSILGLLIGFAMMLMVSSHYHYLANRYPGTGGLYNYVKHLFGYDLAFLIAWFMFLIYASIFWANATSVPLFARYFMQAVFRKGCDGADLYHRHYGMLCCCDDRAQPVRDDHEPGFPSGHKCFPAGRAYRFYLAMGVYRI